MSKRNRRSTTNRAAELERSKRLLLGHWKTIGDHAAVAGKAETVAQATQALEHAAQALPYAIDGRVCHAVFADARTASTRKIDVADVPYKHGIAVFDTPYKLTMLEAELLGLQWGMLSDGIWLVALTRASLLNMHPPHSMFPLSVGYLLPDGADVDFDAENTTGQASAIAVALWRRIPRSDCVLIGPGEGTAVVVSHARRLARRGDCLRAERAVRLARLLRAAAVIGVAGLGRARAPVSVVGGFDAGHAPVRPARFGGVGVGAAAAVDARGCADGRYGFAELRRDEDFRQQ